MKRWTLAQVSVIKPQNGVQKLNCIFQTIGKDFATEQAAKAYRTRYKLESKREENLLGDGDKEILYWTPTEIKHDDTEGRDFVTVGNERRYL